MKHHASIDEIPEKSSQPFLQGDRAVVQCEKYRCLAVSDGNGKWIDHYTHQELKDVKGIVLRIEGQKKQKKCP